MTDIQYCVIMVLLWWIFANTIKSDSMKLMGYIIGFIFLVLGFIKV